MFSILWENPQGVTRAQMSPISGDELDTCCSRIRGRPLVYLIPIIYPWFSRDVIKFQKSKITTTIKVLPPTGRRPLQN